MRFGTDDLGVTQPSQVRYILYFYQIFKEKCLSPTVKYIDNIILYGVPNFNGKNSCKPIVEFISVKTDEKVKKKIFKYKYLFINKLYTDKKNYLNQGAFSADNFTIKEIPYFKIKIEKKIPLCNDVLVRFKNNGF